jgi:arylsulfatase A-like enzyme
MNILFLLTDNQRADLLGCAGNPVIQTPHLDHLAAHGTRFTNAFATTPICAASRASFLTGCYERRHQFTFHTPPLRREFTAASYPEILKSRDYRTGFIGKFGIGSDGIVPTVEGEDTLRRMFDHFDNYEHWMEDGYDIRQTDGTTRHLTDITGDNVIAYLESHARPETQPFCLSVSFNAPHAQDNDPRHYIWPETESDLYLDDTIPEPDNADPTFFASLPEFIRESESRRRWHTRYDSPENYQRNLKGLYRMISGVDRNVGRITQTLERLGLTEDTLIIFASDHGMYYGDRGLSDCWQLNDASIRIPLIVFDPRHPQSAKVREEMALNIDVAPTILDLCDLPIPPHTQGRSLRPLLEGNTTEWRSAFLCEHLFDRSDIPKSEGVRTERWKYIRYFEQRPIYEELYDLVSDPTESHNLAGQMDLAEKLDEMRLQCTDLCQRCS